jgi:hypothetical protein
MADELTNRYTSQVMASSTESRKEELYEGAMSEPTEPPLCRDNPALGLGGRLLGDADSDSRLKTELKTAHSASLLYRQYIAPALRCTDVQYRWQLHTVPPVLLRVMAAASTNCQ